MSILKTCFCLFFTLVLNLLPAQTPEQLELLDRYYEQARSSWGVPGMAIAMVKDGNIIFEKGYGLANQKENIPVDEHTLFAIASNTKAFTAAAFGQLVAQKRLHWNDKVREYLPYFDMKDPLIGGEMTIEDLLCHRSGLKTFSGDLLWYGTDKSPVEIVGNIRWLDPVQNFRSDYGYSNVMYIAAGLVIEAVTDTSWQDYVQEHFLNPLRMQRTLLSVEKLAETANVATPYYTEGDSLIQLEWINWDNVAAAGGLISSAHDMAEWLILNASRGRYYDQKILEDEIFEKMTTPHISFQLSPFLRSIQPMKHFSAYGMGWYLSDNHGRKILSHSGGYDGMISQTTVVPEEGFGLVILTNSLNYLPGALAEKTLDLVLGNLENGTDYSELYLQSYRHGAAEKEKTLQEIEARRGQIDPGHLPLSNYTGHYVDKMYGEVIVHLTRGKLVFTMQPTAIFHASLNHWNGDVFTFRFPKNLSSLPMGKLWFVRGQDGLPEKLYIDIDNPDFDFLEFEFIKEK